MIQAVLAYLVNAAWETPLAAIGAGLLCRLARLSPRARYATWAACLALAVALPAVPSRWDDVSRPQPVASAAGVGAARVRRSGQISPFGPRAMQARLPVDRGLAALLVGAALLCAATALLRLLASVRAAGGLVRRSRPYALDPAVEARLLIFVARSGRALPPIRCSAEVSGPAVVGCRPAVVLVPDGFDRLSADHACAALLHECAHVLRRDYALNLALELVATPLDWHPAIHLLKRRLRAAREAVCDGLAAAEMGSPVRYAERLVELARSIQQARRRRTGAALALFGRGELETRVAELVRAPAHSIRPTPARTLAAVALSGLMILPIALVRVTPSVEVPPAASLKTVPAPVALRQAKLSALRLRQTLPPRPMAMGREPAAGFRLARLRSKTLLGRLSSSNGATDPALPASSPGAPPLQVADASAPPLISPVADAERPRSRTPADLVLRGAPLKPIVSVDILLPPTCPLGVTPAAGEGVSALDRTFASEDALAHDPSAPDARAASLPGEPLLPPVDALAASVKAARKPVAACLKPSAPVAGGRAPGLA